MKLLNKIEIELPDIQTTFKNDFLNFLSNFGVVENNSISFKSSNEEYLPKISLSFSATKTARVRFDEKVVEIKNSTNENKKSPYNYSPISLSEFMLRKQELNFEFLDHVGFDIPWFEGVHPDIAGLRKSLPKRCFYFLYPTGENWDFIIPAAKEEVSSKEITYQAIRRPKFEIVSLDYTSSPIIQFDVSVSENFEQIKQIFPEGIPDNSLKNVWVYIINPYGLDICFVIGHRGKSDWYDFLKK